MQVDDRVGGAHSERPVVEHLEQALEVSENPETNFHVRQAMQLLLTEEC